jgi:hypothetical protein
MNPQIITDGMILKSFQAKACLNNIEEFSPYLGGGGNSSPLQRSTGSLCLGK